MWVAGSGRHILGGKLNELTFKVSLSSGKSLIPDTDSWVSREWWERILCFCLCHSSALQSSSKPEKCDDAVQTVSQVGFGIAEGPELLGDGMLGVPFKVTGRRL